MKKYCCARLAILALSLLPGVAYSQQPQPPRDTTGKIKVESSVTGEYFLREGHYVQRLTENVRLRQDSTVVLCDVAVIDRDIATLSGNVVIEQGDTVKIFADSAYYDANTRQADLYGNVVLVNGRQQLFTSRLHYDLALKIATYNQGATLTNGKSQLTSTRGYYYVNEKQV
ncbi:MAG: LPS export ABC transporter periplasmic protein LptC, partial [Saprospiraceae bacterium]|nr:LPS export ABC transporter periplasmic protein LptC [Saprospiraceae bacterium]